MTYESRCIAICWAWLSAHTAAYIEAVRFYCPKGVRIGGHSVINREVLLDGRMGLLIDDNVVSPKAWRFLPWSMTPIAGILLAAVPRCTSATGSSLALARSSCQV